MHIYIKAHSSTQNAINRNTSNISIYVHLHATEKFTSVGFPETFFAQMLKHNLSNDKHRYD